MNRHIEIFQTSTALLAGASERILNCLKEEILIHGTATFVLSGGNTPRSLYELLGSEKYRDRIDWRKVQLFWGDERSVPPTSPESNFRMASQALIRNIAIPSRNVHRIHAELKPQEAAHAYELEIRHACGLKDDEFPRFTCLMLGLGEDGHTASLFPGTSAPGEKHRIVTGVFVERLATSRITLTLPAINNAATIMFLVSGRAKAAILREVLEDEPPRYPAQLIAPASGELVWFVDQEAASQLQKVHSQ